LTDRLDIYVKLNLLDLKPTITNDFDTENCSALFPASTAAAIIFCWHRRPRSGKFMLDIYPDTVDYRTTARLWVICHLVILFSMNLIVIGVAVFGWEFR